MKIYELEDRGIKVEWKFVGINKSRRQKNRQGHVVAAHATTITIPRELADIISNDDTYTYVYEYFDKAVITPNQPPEDVTFKKVRLNNTTKSKESNKRFELPNVFLDTYSTKYATISYYPNRVDYVSHEKGLFLIDTCGDSPRKHIKRKINTDNNTISYDVYIRQSNAPEDICFHQDIKNIIPSNIYLYILDDTIYLTNSQPGIECIETTEENLIDVLFKQGLIDVKTQKIEYVLYLDENDKINKKVPKIILNPV